METAGDTIVNDLPKLDNATTSELPDVLPGVKTDVANNNTTIETQVQTITDAVGTETAKDIIQTKDDLKAAEEVTETIDKSASDAREGRTAENPNFESKVEGEL